MGRRSHAVSANDIRHLFNGRDLAGWTHIGPGRFVVQDGLLEPRGGMGLLWFEGEKIADAVLRTVYRPVSPRDNSGVFIRLPEPPADPWSAVHRGYEVQIHEGNASDYHCTGTLYSLTRALARPGRIGEWNEMDIVLDDLRTLVYLNGVLVTDYLEGDPTPPRALATEPERGPRPRAGFIGLQNHAAEELVQFREVSVRPLRALREHPPASS